MTEYENTVSYKSKKLALDIISLYKLLTSGKNEFILSKQILKSGTSIGANIAESECASSDKDFLNKLYIALKECNETLYWLDLLFDSNYIDDAQFVDIREKCSEIKRMLNSSTKTIKEKMENNQNSKPI